MCTLTKASGTMITVLPMITLAYEGGEHQERDEHQERHVGARCRRRGSAVRLSFVPLGGAGCYAVAWAALALWAVTLEQKDRDASQQ